MKEFTVDIGVTTYPLRYTKKERRELEEKFNSGLMEILREKFLPLDEKSRPTGGGMWAAQVAILHAGLRHAGPKMTEKKVEEWLDELSHKSDGAFFNVLGQAQLAVFASGVLGFTWVPPDEDEEGKGEPAVAGQP